MKNFRQLSNVHTAEMVSCLEEISIRKLFWLYYGSRKGLLGPQSFCRSTPKFWFVLYLDKTGDKRDFY